MESPHLSVYFKLALASLLLPAMAMPAPQVEPPPLAEKMTDQDRALTIATYEQLTANSTPLAIGDSEEALLARLGEPDGALSFGSKKRLSYDTGYVIIADGSIAEISGIPLERLRSPDPDSYKSYQRARGMIHYMGRWMTVEEGIAAYEKALDDRDRSEQRIHQGQKEKAIRSHQMAQQETPFLDIRRKGALISREELVVPGKITVVEFYADWCAPCKQIAPYLAKFAEDPDVVVRKVDIVNWNSPVAKQWQLRSIPNMRVFDQNGQPVGQATHNLREVVDNIMQAKH